MFFCPNCRCLFPAPGQCSKCSADLIPLGVSSPPHSSQTNLFVDVLGSPLANSSVQRDGSASPRTPSRQELIERRQGRFRNRSPQASPLRQAAQYSETLTWSSFYLGQIFGFMARKLGVVPRVPTYQESDIAGNVASHFLACQAEYEEFTKKKFNSMMPCYFRGREEIATTKEDFKTRMSLYFPESEVCFNETRFLLAFINESLPPGEYPTVFSIQFGSNLDVPLSTVKMVFRLLSDDSIKLDNGEESVWLFPIKKIYGSGSFNVVGSDMQDRIVLMSKKLNTSYSVISESEYAFHVTQQALSPIALSPISPYGYQQPIDQGECEGIIKSTYFFNIFLYRHQSISRPRGLGVDNYTYIVIDKGVRLQVEGIVGQLQAMIQDFQRVIFSMAESHSPSSSWRRTASLEDLRKASLTIQSPSTNQYQTPNDSRSFCPITVNSSVKDYYQVPMVRVMPNYGDPVLAKDKDGAWIVAPSLLGDIPGTKNTYGYCIEFLHTICALHDCNLLHGDVHGSNILVKEREGKLIFTIIDFDNTKLCNFSYIDPGNVYGFTNSTIYIAAAILGIITQTEFKERAVREQGATIDRGRLEQYCRDDLGLSLSNVNDQAIFNVLRLLELIAGLTILETVHRRNLQRQGRLNELGNILKAMLLPYEYYVPPPPRLIELLYPPIYDLKRDLGPRIEGIIKSNLDWVIGYSKTVEVKYAN